MLSTVNAGNQSAPGSLSSAQDPPALETQNSEDALLREDAPGIVRAFMDEVQAFLEESRKTRCAKADLIAALRRIASKYPPIRGSEYQQPLSRLMASESEHLFALRLSAEDLEMVWML